jgi:TonB family protein
MRLLIILPLLATLGAADTIHVSLPAATETIGVWHFVEAFADIPRGAVCPKLVSAPQSSQTKAPPGASVSVSFDIDVKGSPFNIQIDKSSDKELNDEVIAMIREWRFEAAVSGRFAVKSHARIDLSTGEVQPEGRRP